VIGPDFSVHRDQPELAKLKILERLPSGWSASGLVEQGSSRRFYHIRMPDGSSQALMTSSKEDQDFQRFLDIGDFFAKAELRTPRLFARVPEEYAVLMEVLGDDTLYDLVKAARNRSEVLDLYEKVVDALADFQTRGTALLDEGGLELRVFDGAYLRWESAYFMEHFVAGLCRLSPDPAARRAVDAELDALAERALAMPRSLMHRDFQSQNILLPDEEPRFVDFQGARLGPYVYDIASLLKDPYVSLPRDLRDSLRARHFEALKSSGWLPGRVDFRSYLADYNRASLQRNMQALGAYGFLSLKSARPSIWPTRAPAWSSFWRAWRSQGASSPSSGPRKALR
jgi:aminoglycoside/choline kinase family phosphotransferase